MSAEKLKSLHDDFVAEFKGSRVSARLWERFEGRIITAILGNPALKEAAISYLESAWDTVVVPYDIPYVPDDLERDLENFGRSKIRPGVEWALSHLVKAGPHAS